MNEGMDEVTSLRDSILEVKRILEKFQEAAVFQCHPLIPDSTEFLFRMNGKIWMNPKKWAEFERFIPLSGSTDVAGAESWLAKQTVYDLDKIINDPSAFSLDSPRWFPA